MIDEFIKNQGILCGETYSGVVLVARDTRPSGEELLSAAIQVRNAYLYRHSRIGARYMTGKKSV